MDGTTTWVRTAEGWHEAPPTGAHGRPPTGEGVPEGAVVWVRVPQRSGFSAVAEQLGLPPEVVQRCAEHEHIRHRSRAHVEHLDGGMLLTVPTIAYRESTHDVLSGEVTCLALDDVVLTAESGSAGVLANVASTLQRKHGSAGGRSGGVLSALLTGLVGGASDVELALGDAVQALESVVFSSRQSATVEQIYALKREVAEARRGLLPLGSELPELVTDPDDDADADAWLRRLTTAVDRLDHRLEAHDDLLSAMLTAHLAVVSVQQNDDMRRISAWAAIAAAPTLLAGVYGMNFRHMPELAWTWGYPGVIALMVGTSVVLHRLFTRSGWL